MKKLLLLLASTVVTFVLPGCFQSETTIHLNKDGSGTLVEEFRLGAQMVAMIAQLSAIGGPDADADPFARQFSEEKAKKRATELGKGVTLEKFEPLNDEGNKGARVTYQFKDINELQVSPDDGMKNISAMGDAQAPAGEKKHPIGFSFADGKLTIRMPQPEQADAAAGPEDQKPGMPDMDDPEAQAMVKEMMGDLKMSVKVVIEPGIDETNASHQKDNTITLVELNMGKLVKNADNLKKLSTVDQKDPIAAMNSLKGIEGMKFEVEREVVVQLK